MRQGHQEARFDPASLLGWQPTEQTDEIIVHAPAIHAIPAIPAGRLRGVERPAERARIPGIPLLRAAFLPNPKPAD
ncbi:hypothetical protein [Bosea sp. CS1GBMeth4]|uniref:hypothetical protein n=1 Tax=Bosea sp. CS1GBMeth4 TaxID=1892849 RepID=UPI0016485869|nr:hypothetical protein [Bosea sp. CS1GBMeth4]